MKFQKLSLLSVFVLNILFVACSQQSDRIQLPDNLAGVDLVEVESNEVSKSKLAQMHQGLDFTGYESVIGTYRDETNEIKIYVTTFKSEEQSAEMMSAMAENIKAGKSPQFSYVRQIEKDRRVIHFSQSEDLSHYFFQDKRRNIWISAPGDLGEEVLDDFLKKL